MKRKFLDTGYAQFAGLSGQSTRVLKYIVENPQAILSLPELTAVAQSVRMILKTPMAEFFDRLVSDQGLNNFMAMYLPATATSAPEILTVNAITWDLKQVDSTGILRSMPQARNKIIVNLSSVVKPDRTTGRYSVSSIDTLQNLFTRGQLVASYEDSDGWLSPYLGEFATKTYSMIISSLISRYYNLSIPETLQVMGILALYFTQALDRDNGDPTSPALFNRCTFVGNRSELEAIAKLCSDKSKDGLTLQSTTELIAELGPEKLRTFNLSILYNLANNLGPDALTTQIALEYPPYWIWILMLALSGNKIPVVYQLTAQKLAGEGRSKFLQQLLTDNRIFAVTR